MKATNKAATSALRQSLAGALRCLRNGNQISDERAHDARKQLKKARAALRLLRSDLDDAVYRRENRVLRDASRAVSPLRDAKAQLEILAALRERYQEALSSNDLARLEKRLAGKLERARGRIRPSAPRLRRAKSTLQQSQQRLRTIARKNVETAPVTKGLRKIYQRARKSFMSARNNAAPEVLHDWRKKTKYLYNAVQSLDVRNGSPPAVIAEKAHRLGDWLGEDHDLVVLSQELRERAGVLSAPAAHALNAAIKRRRSKLREKALRLGAKTYGDRPKKAIRKV